MQARTRNSGAMQQHLMQFANWETKNAREKTSAVIGLGAAGFKAMAGQSKTAFKLYKAFAITQALIKTYESATGSFAALAPIPIVGPALGAAAAAAAIAMGMQQVRMIKSQQPAGIAHGGLDYVHLRTTARRTSPFTKTKRRNQPYGQTLQRRQPPSRRSKCGV
ncbi:hypothetical protein N480_03580 [Pseudoalteromonas luteoviolacea S2607]|uniref:hypothetical protein n=1 Tax=Pseudoalteromonas luteoviolacea TaxID=43657 RepID=UPI0007B07DAA|nr:hypothetical protein [Pseudoalteromonas luteoviolacea]KZN30038.1 hypothetical protein N480_03580 [Pseudoalteromonas luteoviolacea S2607]